MVKLDRRERNKKDGIDKKEFYIIKTLNYIYIHTISSREKKRKTRELA